MGAIASGGIEIAWEGNNKIENTLYFGERVKNNVQNEIDRIKEIFRNENF